MLKSGKLDEQEWEVMKGHTTLGAELLSDSRAGVVQLARDIALSHHEWWDGTGYPGGLGQTEIPLAGRICAICDVFDALTSPRALQEAVAGGPSAGRDPRPGRLPL